MPRRFRVLGALGDKPLSPLLAEVSRGDVPRTVVLCHPVAGVGAVLSCGVDEEDRVELEGRTVAVCRHVPGIDLGQLVDVDGVGPAELAEVALQVLRAAPPDAMRRVRLAGVRVDPRGLVHVLPGPADRDLATSLAEVIDDVERADAEVLDAIAHRDLGELARRASGPEALALHVGEAAAPVFAHPWVGLELVEGAGDAPVHPKVRTAAFAAVTLLLGLAAGLYLG